MFIYDLFEDAKKRVVVTYPGRFQPFHKGHRDVFASLQRKFGNENVFIVTSNKTDAVKSPFNFSDKVRFMHAMGVPDNQVIETDKVYDLPPQFANIKDQVVFITVVGAPDAKRLNPGATKKDGSPSYFQNLPGDAGQLQSADEHGYVIVEPEHPENISIGGKTYDVSHGTPTRELWNQIRHSPEHRAEFITQLYGANDQALGNVLDKIPTGAEPAPEPAKKMKNVKKDLTKVQHDPNAEQPMAEAGYGRNRGYNHGFASPTAPRLGGRRHREDDEGWDQEEQQRTATWYIRINGKIVKDKTSTPYQFRGREAAVKAARTMMAKPFNAGKQFTLSTSPTDREQGVVKEYDVDEGAIITKDDLVDIYIKGVGKNNMPIQKKVGAQIPNGKVNSFIATVAEKYGLNPKVFVYGPSNPVAEGKWFKTDYGWAGGSKPGGGKYKHPDQLKADREAKKKSKEQEQEKNKQPNVTETVLNPQDPKSDYEAKRKALHDLSLDKNVDQKHVQQRRLDLDKEAKAKGVAEGSETITHRIGLTVTDPNHPMVSKRGETYHKTVRVKGDDREKAINGAIAHYRRKGYKVHDHHYIGTVDDEIKEFAPPGSGDDGNDGFSDETLKRMAAQWYNGDEDPRVEKTLMAAGWEIGQDEGYDDEPGVFVVQAGDVNGNSYMSWPANELRQGMAEDAEPMDREFLLVKKLGRLGERIVQNPKLWDKYSEVVEGDDPDWIISLIQDGTGATFEEVLRLSDLFGEIGGGMGRIIDFAWAVKEGHWEEDFLNPYREYRSKWDMAESGLGLDHKRNRFKSLHIGEEAAGVGVVAGKKQAKDPRYSMSLTKDVRPGQVNKSLRAFRLAENAEQLSVGDPVVITGKGIEFEGKTGDIDSFGDMKRFVVVNLYNHGKHSFHSSDVSYNDYADQEDDLDEDLYQYDKEDPYNSEFAPRAGMGRMTLRGWKQSLIRRTAELAQQMSVAGQDIDKAALWDHVYAKLKSMNMDPIAQEIEQAQAELEKIRQRGGIRSRAFNK
jgi:hypothetical protein